MAKHLQPFMVENMGDGQIRHGLMFIVPRSWEEKKFQKRITSENTVTHPPPPPCPQMLSTDAPFSYIYVAHEDVQSIQPANTVSTTRSHNHHAIPLLPPLGPPRRSSNRKRAWRSPQPLLLPNRPDRHCSLLHKHPRVGLHHVLLRKI